jgi:hypothetical protein
MSNGARDCGCNKQTAKQHRDEADDAKKANEPRQYALSHGPMPLPGQAEQYDRRSQQRHSKPVKELGEEHPRRRNNQRDASQDSSSHFGVVGSRGLGKAKKEARATAASAIRQQPAVTTIPAAIV